MTTETKPDPVPRERLGFLRPQARATRNRASRLVGWLRIGFPAVALLVVASLVLWPVIRPDRIIGVAIKNMPDLVVKNLHFTGLDSKNEPYSLTAEKATRPGGFKNVYDFEKPEAEITLQNGAWITGKALQGRFDQSTRQLWLGGDVQLFHDKGYQFTTNEAQIDLNQNDAWGEKPVHIQGGFGEIDGQGFKLMDSGHIMVITGPARATLDLRPPGGSDKPERQQ